MRKLLLWNLSLKQHQILIDFNEVRDDGVAVGSAWTNANHLNPTSDKQPHQHFITQFFYKPVPFLTPNQQCQSTEWLKTQLNKSA